jgi:hypothetical protein
MAGLQQAQRKTTEQPGTLEPYSHTTLSGSAQQLPLPLCTEHICIHTHTTPKPASGQVHNLNVLRGCACLGRGGTV